MSKQDLISMYLKAKKLCLTTVSGLKKEEEKRANLQSHAHAASRLAEDGDGVRVTPEGPDVVLDPLEGQPLVPQAVVAWQRVVVVAGGEEAEDPEAVLYGDDDHPPVGHQLGGSGDRINITLIIIISAKKMNGRVRMYILIKI